MKNLPERIPLAQLPTPIIKLNQLSAKLGKNIYLWRDDLTGFVESGNKVRKLEFLFAEALAARCTTVLTCGGFQSNHVRATVALARRLGLKPHCVIRLPQNGQNPEAALQGNALLDLVLGAESVLVPYRECKEKGYAYFLEGEYSRLTAKGERVYLIPEGGSCPLGCFGYYRAVSELLSTWSMVSNTSHPDSLFFALGSGGTHAGLFLGCVSADVSTDILYAVNVCDDEKYFQRAVSQLVHETADKYRLPEGKGRLQILDGYVGRGYGIATDEEISFYIQTARSDGLVLDPCYTGKAFIGMVNSIRNDPGRFGRNILFLHSGGLFANFSYADQFSRVGHSLAF